MSLAAPPRPEPRPASEDLEAFVRRAMRELDVPGVGLAVVKDGRVVAARGFGVRRLGTDGAVDGATRFGIASLTKAFTAVAVGLLVDEGKLEWDAPIVRYLPWFQAWDPSVTRELTIRDLLAHRTGLGLGQGDLLWFPADTCDRTEFVRRVRWMKPPRHFRAGLGYGNTQYVVAGAIVEAVSGEPWETFVARRILAKVGMRGTETRLSASGRGANAAAPHARIAGAQKPVPPLGGDVVDPAGGLSSSAEDMAAWLRLLLAGGKLPDGSRLYSENTARELWTVVTPVRPPPPDPKMPPALAAVAPTRAGYGLGFFVRNYRGRELVTHTGTWTGFSSILALVPEIGLGVVVFTNDESDQARRAILYRVLDEHLGAPTVDWVEVMKADVVREDEALAKEEQDRLTARAAAVRPPLPLATYAGTYADGWFGSAVVTAESDGLVLRFPRAPALVADLEHWQHDTFVARWRTRELRADAFVTFALDHDGTVERVRMKAVSSATDWSYDFGDLLLEPARGHAP